MSDSSITLSDNDCLVNELTCYLQKDAVDIALTNMQNLEHKYDACYRAQQYHYQLPLGNLSLLELILYLPAKSSLVDIKAARMAVVKAALIWHKTYLAQHKNNANMSHNVLVFDIQRTDKAEEINKIKINNQQRQSLKRLIHGFGVRYFMEDLVVDMSDSMQQLQVFSWHDWQAILASLQAPCELWRFLHYRLGQLQSSASNHVISFESEADLVTQFLHSPTLFTDAIAVDNALIKYEVRDEPNPALVAMTLAYKNKSTTAQMYHQHMAQAAALWSQLSTQMIEMLDAEVLDNADKETLGIKRCYWQQQLLDESLFSRHELVRTLYRHPKQGHGLQKEGYVVHQHSYESLGRHYVLIFYGQDVESQHSKQAIQPNLAKIAKDVASRLPIAELHHVIVLGIDFIDESNDTFIDIDLWIQPFDPMTQRERQLTKQLQRLNQQHKKQNTNNLSASKNESMRMQLNLNIPARNTKY
ncbi:MULTISPECIES: hypothetical protein [unclassified Psychrobacter]|uniref:hypothetical protein n=1 Tax=unclassified Psychrobacter TaxID=196806 RepID=UPI000760B8DD|nr:hypothetical protein [Psychrobacter sp. P11F6]